MHKPFFNVIFLLILLFLAGCRKEITEFKSSWNTTPDRIWAGPDYWANRLQDWRIYNEKLECVQLYPMRTLHLLTMALSGKNEDFSSEINIDFHPEKADSNRIAGAGILFGAGDGLDYRAAALIHHSFGKKAGLFAGVDEYGGLFLLDAEEKGKWLARQEPVNIEQLKEVELVIKAAYSEKAYLLSLEVYDPSSGQLLNQLKIPGIPPQRLKGHIALVVNAGDQKAKGSITFSNWHLKGNKLQAFPKRNCGPVLSTQHTLSRGTLKLTAQLMPLGKEDDKTLSLQVYEKGRWRTIARTTVVEPGFTAHFKIEDWNDREGVSFRANYSLMPKTGASKEYYHSGDIRPNPVEKEHIVIAAFTGNHNVVRPNPGKWGGVDTGQFPWDWGLWFPHGELIANVSKQHPDLLFFSGDQVYEGASPTWADREHPFLDYLYKWYLWCWAFDELTAGIPAVTIPDDHDVYHGNIWGAGGIATPAGLSGQKAQDSGGYKMSPDFVKMVERTQTSHLPDPYDPTPAAQGIGVYYTSMNFGGVSFAIIEDRKFKSAPNPLLPEAQVVNGWYQNTAFNPKTQSDAPGANLLGERQLAFVEHWAGDWSQQAWMKVVLSQTIFANLATLPEGSSSDAVVPKLKIPEPGEYPEDDLPVADMDSNGWPQSGRNKAIKAMRKGFAVHIAGDQHLGSTIQYGVEDWNDAGFALCVPSIANFWPRRWFPRFDGKSRKAGLLEYTGEFEDGFGNKMIVYAVSNPSKSGKEPAERHDKAPGYGIVKLDKNSRQITFENWPIWSNPEHDGKPYPGWPVTFNQLDNYGKKAMAYLPTLEISGMETPVVQVVKEKTGEIVYTLRIKGKSFQPWVFEPGRYVIRIGEPDTGNMREFSGISAGEKEEVGKMSVPF